ncbi:MAG: hypothetical protein K6G91_13595, partial [Kiritimatiellae bacterium]|nr:hypothetical protein [Kiritimatiellia bacterium]
QSVSYLNTCQACNPGSEPVASHEQYITNKSGASPDTKKHESGLSLVPTESRLERLMVARAKARGRWEH